MTMPQYQRQGYGRFLIDFSEYQYNYKFLNTLLFFLFFLISLLFLFNKTGQTLIYYVNTDIFISCIKILNK